METLLNNDFTAHYGLTVSTTANINTQTNAIYFEIEDDEHKETKIHFTVGSGMAVYRNTNQYEVSVINYDKFITGLPHRFQHGKERCDLVVYTSQNPFYFLLNELKDRKPKPKVRNKAVGQMIESLRLIMAVPSIATFANTHNIKRCCFFNKQSIAPSTITAPSAFNRINTISPNGLKMSNSTIEAFEFELFEYSGGHTFVM